MNSLLRSLLIGSSVLLAPLALPAQTAPAPAASGAFSTQQLSDGLKSGMGSILSQALGQGGVSITPPPALAKIQSALGKTGQAAASTGFADALKAAVAQVSPQTSGLLQTALNATKIENPGAVLSGGTNAGTQYLQKTIGPAVREKLLPLVKQATASSALGAKAKDMLALAGPLAALGGGKAVGDLDAYVTDQVLAQSFALIAKQEAAVRANPALLTDNPLAQKVFAYFKK